MFNQRWKRRKGDHSRREMVSLPFVPRTQRKEGLRDMASETEPGRSEGYSESTEGSVGQLKFLGAFVIGLFAGALLITYAALSEPDDLQRIREAGL